jgi:hypothetical protein
LPIINGITHVNFIHRIFISHQYIKKKCLSKVINSNLINV